MTSTSPAADLTLYLVETAGGADAGGESRLALGPDDAARAAQELTAGGAPAAITPVAVHDEPAVLAMCDDADHVLVDVFGLADAAGLEYDDARCDAYALLLALRRPPIAALEADAAIAAERNHASAMDRLEAALAAGVPIADLLAAQALRIGPAARCPVALRVAPAK